MKTMKTLFFTIITLSSTMPAVAQQKDTSEIREIVESKNYIFMAQQAYPQNGITRILTPGYDLTVRVDTVISYLPFFGRAYVAPLNPFEGGIKFLSSDFRYEMKKLKSKWEITIRPKDVSEVQQLNLDIFDNGSATLRVINTNRQPISFNGYVEKGMPKEKRAF
jgi:hypothetical protein